MSYCKNWTSEMDHKSNLYDNQQYLKSTIISNLKKKKTIISNDTTSSLY